MKCPPLEGEPIIKKDGEDLFKHPIVRKWYDILFNEWKSSKPIAVLLPCTSVKPYNRSPTHKLAYSIAKKKGAENLIQFYSVSEPMLLVPREYEDCYPFNSYDYPPSKMTLDEKKEFVELLGIAFIKVLRNHKKVVAILPKHHYDVVKQASLKGNIAVELYPYGRLAFKTIANVLNNLIASSLHK